LFALYVDRPVLFVPFTSTLFVEVDNFAI